MHSELLPLLRSPEDGGPLSLAIGEYEGGDIRTGTLTDGAGHVFPITDGIPRLLPLSLLEGQKTEMAARDAQADDYDRMRILALMGRVEIPWTRRWLAAQPTDTVLEAGCGTGRQTPHLAQDCRTLVSVDFSLASLVRNARKLHAAGVTNVHLVQADLCRLPLHTELFHRVASGQVLEHVPGAEAQARAVGEMARVAKSGATLVLSAYKDGRLMRLGGGKTGEHDGGIPFYRFTRDEMRAVLSSHWDVEAVHGGLLYVWQTRSVRR